MDKQVKFLSRETAASWLPRRPEDGHKGTFGKVCVIGGSVGLTGAPVLASKAAARTGSGLVFLGVPEEIYGITAPLSLEVMTYPLPGREGRLSAEAFFRIQEKLGACDAGLIGPGLGRNRDLSRLVSRLLEQVQIPLVVDADALYAIREQKEILKHRREKGLVTVLTPHEGEFSYLGGECTAERREGALDFARTWGCILVRKGPGTLIADPEGNLYQNTTGNSGMAKGGSGDILGGMILSLLGQGMEPVRAAALGAWLHGCAGDLCKEEIGEYGMLPTDMLERIPEAIRRTQGG